MTQTNGPVARGIGALGLLGGAFGLVVVLTGLDCEDLGCLVVPFGYLIAATGLSVAGIALLGGWGLAATLAGSTMFAGFAAYFAVNRLLAQTLIFTAAGAVPVVVRIVRTRRSP